MKEYLTRIDKWKDYRKDINQNISLQKSIVVSNEKLQILSKRLKVIFPKYKTKYFDKREEINLQEIKLDQVFKPKLFEIERSEKIIEEIIKLESNEEHSLQFIEKFNFSSGQLDKIIEEVKIGKSAEINYVEMQDEEIKMTKMKKIVLPKEKTNG